MTDSRGPQGDDGDAPELRVLRKVPEVAAVVILTGLGLLVLGGLATGIAAAAEAAKSFGPTWG